MCKKIVGLVLALSFLVFSASYNESVFGESLKRRGLSSDPVMRTGLFSGRGRIIGTIINRKGEPVANATVFVEPMGGDEDSQNAEIKSVQTNSDGRFKIRRVPVGRYKVTVVPQEGDNLFSSDKFNVNVFARKAAMADMELSAKVADGASYVGSAACQACHGGKHSAWVETAHAKTHLSPSVSTVVAPFDNTIRLTSDGKVKFRAFTSEVEFEVTVFDLNDESVFVTYEVARTHGGVAVKGKQRYHVKIDNSHYILPVQYNNHNVDPENPDDAWVSYHPERWYNEDGTLRTPDVDKHSFEQNCEGCHATGLKIDKVSNEFISSSTEIGIGCEECHGPGSIHANSGGGNGNNIINPEFMTVEAASQTCGQCHTRVVSTPGDNGANFATGYPAIVDVEEIIAYEAGKDLGNFASFTKSDGSATPGFWNDNDVDVFGDAASVNNHSKKHHQQVIDFTKSYHFIEAGLMCFDCHSPHSNAGEAQLRLNNDDNSLCLQCHADKEEMGLVANDEGEFLNVHTKHVWDPEGSKASRCSGCHMPKTAKSAVFTDIHSHVFDIIKPAVSLAMAEKNSDEGIENDASSVIMNACFSCHPDEDFGAARFIGWESKTVE